MTRSQPILATHTFWKTVTAGFIATFVMTITGFWQSGLGLPPIDVGAMLAQNMTAAHPEQPYGLLAGNVVHFVNGILLALLWVSFGQSHIRTNWFVQGLVYGIITTLAAAIVIVPLVAGAGVFFSNSPAPVMMTLASLSIHLAYSLALTLSLKVAGVSSEPSESAERFAGAVDEHAAQVAA